MNFVNHTTCDWEVLKNGKKDVGVGGERNHTGAPISVTWVLSEA